MKLIHLCKYILLLIIVCININDNLFARHDILDEPENNKKDEVVEQSPIGNFALRSAQIPGPLIAFGQNIFEKGNIQLLANFSWLTGNRRRYEDFFPTIIYGISDRSSILMAFPIAFDHKLKCDRSHGLQDFFMQFEYALYSKNTESMADQVTVVASFGFPTGSPFKSPSLGFGSPSFFLGLTANHLDFDWYAFASAGAILTTPFNCKSKFGNQILYQGGLGKNICYKSHKWIFNWLLEFDGIYKQHDKRKGIIDPNTGGHQIFLGPSLWFSTPNLIVQGGVSWTVIQHLFGQDRNQDKYIVVASIGWTF